MRCPIPLTTVFYSHLFDSNFVIIRYQLASIVNLCDDIEDKENDGSILSSDGFFFPFESMFGAIGGTIDSGDRIALFRGKNIVILSPTTKKHVAIQLQNVIQAGCWSSNAKVLVVGDSCGCLHFIRYSGALLYSHPLHPQPKDGNVSKPPFSFKKISFVEQPSFCSVEDEEMIILLSNATVMRFTHVKIGALDDAAMTGDKKMLASVRSALKVQRVDMSEHHSDNFSDVVRLMAGNSVQLVTGGSGKSALTTWCVSSRSRDGSETPLSPSMSVGKLEYCDSIPVSLMFPAGKVMKVLPTQKQASVLVLDNHGHLSLWDSTFLVCIAQWLDMVFTDFILLPSNGDTVMLAGLVSTSKVIGSTGSEGGVGQGDETTMELNVYSASIPNIKLLHSFPVSGKTKFLSSPSLGDDKFYILESTKQSSTGEDSPDPTERYSIKICAPSSPRERIESLMQSNKFDEAISLAKEHRMDEIEIRKQQLHYLVSQAAQASEDNNTFPIFNQGDASSTPSSVILQRVFEIIANLPPTEYAIVTQICMESSLYPEDMKSLIEEGKIVLICCVRDLLVGTSHLHVFL